MDASEVQLTEEEKEKALSSALEEKKALHESMAKASYTRAVHNAAQRKWTNKEFLEYSIFRAARNEMPFTIDDQLKPVVKALVRYFSNDPSFETLGEGWSLNKGLYLIGNIGSGKTTLLRAFNVNQRGCYQVMSCRKLTDLFIEHGPEVLHTYSGLLNTAKGFDNLYQDKLGICFDDLGTERQGKRFGDSANVMEQILLNRYDNPDAPWYYTHMTSNLSAEEVEEMYGSRVRSRMREMFNTIEVTGPDRRK
jgi:DNA replication protein DnaC